MNRLLAALAAATLAGACTGGSTATTTPEEPAPTAIEAERPDAAEPDHSAEALFVSTPAVEEGFTHCCGTLDYKMEVECGDRLKRCYIQEGGVWKQTYGRHCKSNLGESCYLHICDDACGS